LGRTLTEAEMMLLAKAMPVLKVRAKTVIEIAEGAEFLFDTRPISMDEKAATLLGGEADVLLGKALAALKGQTVWELAALEEGVKAVATEAEVGLGKVAQPLRAALTGRGTSPGIFDVLVLLGREESLARIEDCLGAARV
jgi:glutamyl-tRNA synthetase